MTPECDPHAPLRLCCKMFACLQGLCCKTVILTSCKDGPAACSYSLTYTTVGGLSCVGCALLAVLSIAASQAALLHCCLSGSPAALLQLSCPPAG